MTRLTELPRPFIVCVVTDRTVEQAITTMRLARFDGADAYELNLPALPAAGPDDLRRLVASVDRPVYTTCRRAAFMGVYGFRHGEVPDWADEERVGRQLAAVDLGAVAIDLELDAFDPRPAPPLGTPQAGRFARAAGAPAEVSHDPAAIARQRATIARAHDLGAEVILSCHTGRPQSADGLVRIAELAAERGADLVKIVSPCLQMNDLLSLFDATARLRDRLGIPFVLVGAGEVGTPSRSLGPLFGSSWVIGQQTLVPGGFHPQPLVAHLRETLRLLPWRYQGDS